MARGVYDIKKKIVLMNFEVFMVVHMNTCIVVSCNVTPYRLVARYQQFVET